MRTVPSTGAAGDPAAIPRDADRPLTGRSIIPVAAAIGAFGVVYGTVAAPVLGPTATVASSLFIFSGTVQFAMIGLLGAGASATAVLATMVMLNLRLLALGALVRPRVADLSVLRRAGLAWFLIDETVGLALVGGRSVARTLVRSGVLCHTAWVAGTAVGLAGAELPELETLAAATSPLLFIGLASLFVTSSQDAGRALGAAALVAVVVVTLPALAGVAPILAAVAVAVVGPLR